MDPGEASLFLSQIEAYSNNYDHFREECARANALTPLEVVMIWINDPNVRKKYLSFSDFVDFLNSEG